jgi:hypothetical protein
MLPQQLKGGDWPAKGPPHKQQCVTVQGVGGGKDLLALAVRLGCGAGHGDVWDNAGVGGGFCVFGGIY